MKKQSLSLTALFIVLVFGVVLVSCSKDDDGGGGNIGDRIVGKWQYADTEGTGYVRITYNFYPDGLYEFEVNEGSYSTPGSPSYSYSLEESGRYSLSGNTLTLDCQVSTEGFVSTGRETYKVKIKGEKLTLTDEDGYEDVYYYQSSL